MVGLQASVASYHNSIDDAVVVAMAVVVAVAVVMSVAVFMAVASGIDEHHEELKMVSGITLLPSMPR